MYSLKRQLSKSLLINMIVIMLALLGGLSFMMLQLLENYVATRLQHDAESLVSVLHRNTEGEWRIDAAHMSTIYNRVRSGYYYRVRVGGQDIRSRSLFDWEIVPAASSKKLSSGYLTHGPGDEQLLVWEQQVSKNDALIELWVAEDIAPLRERLYRLSAYALLALLLLALVSLYVQHYIVERAFAVFDRLRGNLKSLRQQDSEIAPAGMPREIQPLLDEIGLLVEHLGQRTRRTRNAIANLSHELKRPLQVLSLEVDEASARDPARQAVSDIRAIIDRELRRAKLSGSDRLGGECSIVDEVPYLAEMMRRIYPAIYIEVDIQQGLHTLALDRDDMLELLGNLLDNACKFAAGKVRFSAATQHSRLLLCFEDDGDGVDKEALPRLTRLGFRLDESVQGHGLGLSICADIVSSFHGVLEFSESSLGGLRVDVKLPVD